ncbi:MAG TPA: SgcJ/EcaC family oxidoreductase [Pirellulales bacterium]|nr:SgcJ/EcaC family oxidoreductase [Pirellulales bacterium]
MTKHFQSLRSAIQLAALSVCGATLAGAASVAVYGADPAAASKATASDDEKAIRASADEFVKAFNAGDPKTIGAEWSPDAEYTDELGVAHHGRASIEDYYSKLFKEHKGGTIAVKIESIRFLGPNVAIEKGIATDKAPSGESSSSRYTVVHARRDGKWEMVDCKDEPYFGPEDQDHLKDLEWLVGEWKIDAGDKSEDRRVKFEWVGGRNFIKSNYTATKDGKSTLTGGQIIGWHPKKGRIVSMQFEAGGGFGNNLWTKDGSKWVLDATGVLPDGSDTTAVNIITPLDANDFTWQSVKRTLDGVKLPDVPPVKVTRVKTAK